MYQPNPLESLLTVDDNLAMIQRSIQAATLVQSVRVRSNKRVA